MISQTCVYLCMCIFVNMQLCAKSCALQKLPKRQTRYKKKKKKSNTRSKKNYHFLYECVLASLLTDFKSVRREVIFLSR